KVARHKRFGLRGGGRLARQPKKLAALEVVIYALMIKTGTIALIMTAALTLTACARSNSSTSTVDAPEPAAAPKPVATSDAPPAFNASRAMQYVKEIVAFGPRPIGSENHKKVENYIVAHLKADEVEQDALEVSPPEGKFPVRNIIAKFPGTKDG